MRHDRVRESPQYLTIVLLAHFHWALDDILELEHAERLRYVAEIANLNRRASDERHGRGG